MDVSMQINVDHELIDQIVCKVKSEGLFDQFRRECLADVDTKPAYQNLLNRVESSVSSFLDEQEWSLKVNKNHVREKLRKLIAGKKFFEVGCCQVVDQVVNPKLNTNFVPKIEDVAYKFLGIERPSLNIKLKVEIDTDIQLPVCDLEQVSPDSEKSQSNSKPEHFYLYDYDVKNDDLESPAFEPINASIESKIKEESRELSDGDEDMDISDGDDLPHQPNGFTIVSNDEMKSNLSSISGLTSNDSNISTRNESTATGDKSKASDRCELKKKKPDSAAISIPLENIVSNSSEINDCMNQDSIMSQVSSSSRLSIITSNNTNTELTVDRDKSNQLNIAPISFDHITARNVEVICPFGITEEARMQDFNENSSSNETSVRDTFDNDFFQGRIRFEGAERKKIDVEMSTEVNKSNKYLKGSGISEESSRRAGSELKMEEQKKKRGDPTKHAFNFEYYFGTSTEVKSSTRDLKDLMNADNSVTKTEKKKEIRPSFNQSNGNIQQLMNQLINETDYQNQQTNPKSPTDQTSDDHRELDTCSGRCEEMKISPSVEIAKGKEASTFGKNPRLKHSSDPPEISEYDDHLTLRGNISTRQRSNSKNSNDGSSQSNINFSLKNNEESKTNNPSSSSSSNETDNNISNPIPGNTLSQIDSSSSWTSIYDIRISNQDRVDERISHPVVIDQILSGKELNLNSFIGDNRNDPVVSSIEKTLSKKNKIPKMAANLYEAKRLMKIRKQIELKNQKEIEKATVMAKQYIRTNNSSIREQTQGIELEFICKRNGKSLEGPIISSPISYNDTNIFELIQPSAIPTIIAEPKSEEKIQLPEVKETSIDDGEKSFIGFEETEEHEAKLFHQNFFNKVFNKVSLHFNKEIYDLATISEDSRKRNIFEGQSGIKFMENNTKSLDGMEFAVQKHNLDGDKEMIMANVWCSTGCGVKRDVQTTNTTLEKQRQKTRYSNDDLFKPRPILGGISRRRRGYNCSEQN